MRHTLLRVTAFLLFSGLAAAQTATVNLSWTASPSPQIAKYAVYRADKALGPFVSVGNSGNATTLTFSQGFVLTASTQDYFFAIRTVTTDGSESDNSNVVHATIPAIKPLPPTQKTCTITISPAGTVTGTCQ